MESESHIGEAAELYALGVLDDAERATVDTHIATCAHCLRRVGEAEETVLALERATKASESAARSRNVTALPRRGLPAWWLPAAAAAALIAGLLFPRQSPQHDLAAVAMLHSHFSHAQFSGAQNSPAAKVLYARDRSWYYVIVEGQHRYAVYGIRAGAAHALGAIEPRGLTSELFVSRGRAFDRVELRDRTTVVETAAIR